MTRRARSTAASGWVAASTFLVLAAAACGGGVLGQIPPGLEDEVVSARQNLEDHWEGLPRATFAFVSARCRADGGLVVLFAKEGFPGAGELAFAMQGPGAEPGFWSGGFGVADPATDPEIVAFFAEKPEVSCVLAPR